MNNTPINSPHLKKIFRQGDPIGVAVMMMSSNENIFRVTGHLCGEFTGLPAFMLSLICPRINGWVNNCESDDLVDSIVCVLLAMSLFGAIHSFEDRVHNARPQNEVILCNTMIFNAINSLCRIQAVPGQQVAHFDNDFSSVFNFDERLNLL